MKTKLTKSFLITSAVTYSTFMLAADRVSTPPTINERGAATFVANLDIDKATGDELFHYGVSQFEKEKGKKTNIWLQRAADKGNSKANALLGVFYFEKEDWANAFKYLKDANEHEAGRTPKTVYYLGECYSWGYGCLRDGKKSFELYQSAFYRGYRQAAVDMAICYCNGDAGEKNFEKAKEWASEVKSEDFPEAWFLWGGFHLVQYEAAKELNNLQQAALWLKRAAERNQPDATSELAHLYLTNSKELNIDEEESKQAIPLLLKSVALGDPGALLFLTASYMRGEHVENDFRVAASLAYQSKDWDILSVRLYNLGMCLLEPPFRNYEEGVALLIASDKMGCSVAALQLRRILSTEEAKEKLFPQEKKIEARCIEILKQDYYTSETLEKQLDLNIIDTLLTKYGINKNELLKSTTKRILTHKMGGSAYVVDFKGNKIKFPRKIGYNANSAPESVKKSNLQAKSRKSPTCATNHSKEDAGVLK